MPNQLALVVDEEITLNRKHRYRIQIWRGRDVQPVVLMIGVEGSPPPAWYTTTLATIALRQFLGFNLPLPIFFQYAVIDGAPRAFRVNFQISGHALRPWLSNPSYGKVDSATVKRVFNLIWSNI
jgi:hypothetical protein